MTLDREESRSHLRQDDLLRLGWQGLRTHPVRATLSALGIAIGIAAMIAVIGISLSSQAKIQERLASLGTNLLTVTPASRLAETRPGYRQTRPSGSNASREWKRSAGWGTCLVLPPTAAVMSTRQPPTV